MLEPIAIAIVEHQGRYLVGKRLAGVALAGMAEFPGGKVQACESTAEAAVRECREETGLEVSVCGLVDRIVHAYEHATVELFFYRCRLNGPSTVEEPRPPFAWLTAEELANCVFPEANRPILGKLVKPIEL